MNVTLKMKTPSGITAQVEDWSAAEIKNPHRLSVFLPIPGCKGKYRSVQFAFDSAKQAQGALYEIAYENKQLKDYVNHLVEPGNKHLLP
jgi:hypothetical protein